MSLIFILQFEKIPIATVNSFIIQVCYQQFSSNMALFKDPPKRLRAAVSLSFKVI